MNPRDEQTIAAVVRSMTYLQRTVVIEAIWATVYGVLVYVTPGQAAHFADTFTESTAEQLDDLTQERRHP